MSTSPPVSPLHPDPADSARDAGLRYISHRGPGITRKRHGQEFRYTDAKGAPVTDEKTLARIRSLGIPPAYERVWICPAPNGHLQATGRDARGRVQYRYHPRWQEVRDAAKYGGTAKFGEALPALRARIGTDLARPGLPREKIVATVVRLLDETHIRVGNEEYAKTNASYGLTTLHTDHVDVDGGTLHFHFRGKSGKHHAIDIRDARVARVVKRCQELPGEELFEWLDDTGSVHKVGSGDVNDYLRDVTGQDFTAKDFRTWAGTLLAARALAECPACENAKAGKRAISDVIKAVARELGNTPAVCRKCYVHPAVLEAFQEGRLWETLDGTAGDAEEAALLALLTAAQIEGVGQNK